LEALDIDAVEAEVDELRTALKDAAAEVRAAIKAANEAVEAALKLCEPDSDGMLDGEQIAEAIQALGGAHSGVSGPLDDLGTTADTLDSATEDAPTVTTDGQAPGQEGAP
jgi:hypothetical protein